jgi:WD40 repeat protein
LLYGLWYCVSDKNSAILSDLITTTPIQTFKHNKFVNLTAFSPSGEYIVTAGHDRMLHIYSVDTPHKRMNEDDLELLDETDDEALAGEPTLRYKKVKTVELETNPEGLVFTPTHLIYTLRSSHLLYFLSLPTTSTHGQTDGSEWRTRTKSFNPSPLDTHVSFSVLYLALHPGGKLVACMTGDPATTGAGERVLIYSTDILPEEDEQEQGDGEDLMMQGVQSQVQEAIPRPIMGAEGERLACLWTGEVGDEYVLPRMTWLPDGSGIM